MTDIDILKHELEEYARRAGISVSTLGRLAGQGGDFYQRISRGCRVWPETSEKVRAYMAENPPTKQTDAA